MSTSLYAAAAALRDDPAHTARLISCAAEQLQAAGQDPEAAEAWVQAHRMALSITPLWPAKGAQAITDGDILSRIQGMLMDAGTLTKAQVAAFASRLGGST